MSLLDEAAIPEDGPLICTIAGDPGLGKSSLAALFPKPIFLCAEDGIQRIAKEIRPKGLKIRSTDEFKAAFMALLNDEHDYKTVVIDSVTALEAIFESEVIKNDPKNPVSINQAAGGYGNGPKAVGAKHENVRKACFKLAEKRDMNVVFIAHADMENRDLPDFEPYMRYSFRLSKHSMRPYVDEVNLIGFVRMEMFLRGEDNDRVKKARDTGDRVFDCVTRASSIAKNGYQIKEPIVFKEGVNPLAEYIPRLQQQLTAVEDK